MTFSCFSFNWVCWNLNCHQQTWVLSSKLPYLIKDKVKLKVLVYTHFQNSLANSYIWSLNEEISLVTLLFWRLHLGEFSSKISEECACIPEIAWNVSFFTCAWHHLAVLARQRSSFREAKLIVSSSSLSFPFPNLPPNKNLDMTRTLTLILIILISSLILLKIRGRKLRTIIGFLYKNWLERIQFFA